MQFSLYLIVVAPLCVVHKGDVHSLEDMYIYALYNSYASLTLHHYFIMYIRSLDFSQGPTSLVDIATNPTVGVEIDSISIEGVSLSILIFIFNVSEQPSNFHTYSH